jgi:hypothetical protein
VNDTTRQLARDVSPTLREVLDTITQWRAEHPEIADWRVEDAYHTLRKLTRQFGYLVDGHPDFSTALANVCPPENLPTTDTGR